MNGPDRRPWMRTNQARSRKAVAGRLVLELIAFMWVLIAPVIMLGLAGPA